MEEKLRSIFPEIDEIGNPLLQKNVLNTYADALRQGGWEPEDLYQIPFTLDFPEFIFSYADHVHGVTRISRESAAIFNKTYASNSRYRVDMDLVIAGALLHDVGKLVEYGRTADGTYEKTALGKMLRHPVSGAIIASRNGCSPELCHIIAVHAAEGDCSRRSPEAIIINKADFINFDLIDTLRVL